MYIHFGILNKKLLIPFLFPIFLQLRGLIRSDKYKVSYAIKEFASISCLILFIIIYFIQKLFIRQPDIKSENQNKLQNKQLSQNNDLIKREKNEKNSVKKVLFFIFVAFCLFIPSIQKIFTKDYVEDFPITNLEIFFEVLFLVPLSMMVLGLSIFSHQKISIIIILVCLFIIIIEDIVYNKLGIEQIIKTLSYTFFFQLFYCLADAFGIKYLNIYVDNIFLFLFKIGIINTCALLIFSTITHFMNVDNGNLEFFQGFKKLPILLFIVDLFISFLYEMGLWLTMYYFSPCHYFIFETISDFIEYILNATYRGYNYKVEQLITFFILYPILIFAILVFNEVIILNFCGLNYNTKIKILEREIEDIYNADDLNSDTLSEVNEDINELGYIMSKNRNKNKNKYKTENKNTFY
jgi:hypothetical protein